MDQIRKIIHFDMDYFFAQVEERDNPSLKNLPIAVGGSASGRGVLCTSNYIARKFGVKSAMPTFKALKLCPDLVLIPPNFDKYNLASKQVFDIFSQHTDKIQAISCDEAYLDVTHVEKKLNSATILAQQIKKEILDTTGLTASAGVSCNKLLAKICSEQNKPNGLTTMSPENLTQKVKNFTVDKIQGVGKKTATRMHEMGIYTFGDLTKYSIPELVTLFGSFGPDLYQYARGIDEREVYSSDERKSLSAEHTFAEDIRSPEKLREKLVECYEDFLARFQNQQEEDNQAIRSVFIKIKYSDFTQTTAEKKCLYFELSDFEELLVKRIGQRHDPVRLIGVGVRFRTEKENQLLLI